MRQCTRSTADNIARFDSLPTKPTWLKLALSDVRNGKPMSLKRERRMCEALGIDPPPVMVETPACPDCGSVHNGGRCNGKPVTVVLRRQRTPPPAWVREATENLIELMEAKEAVR